MKVLRIFSRSVRRRQTMTTVRSIPPCPIVYDRNNVTAKEFRAYLRWLSENNIGTTVQEPSRFVTEAERKALINRKKDVEVFRVFVRNLSKSNSSMTFYC